MLVPKEPITIQQHFVPQSHLKRFVSPRDKKLCVYKKSGEKIKKKYYPVQVCKKDYLYEFSAENPDNRIEKAFGHIESEFSTLFDKKLSKITGDHRVFELDEREKEICAAYILRLFSGNPRELFSGDEDYWKLWKRGIYENCKTEKEKQEALDIMEKEKVIQKQKSVPTTVSVLFDPGFYYFLLSHRFVQFITSPKGLFVTSDNPVDSFVHNSKKEKFNGIYGPGFFEFEYQVAVSPHLMMCFMEKADIEYIVLTDIEDIGAKYYRDRLFAGASEYIYSKD